MLTEQQLQQLKLSAQNLREAAETLKENADEIIGMISNGTQILTPSHPKEIRLLALLKAVGGTVTRDEFHKLGEQAGYDVRGLAALYAYSPNNAVTKLANDKVGLTPCGSKKIEKYSDWLDEQRTTSMPEN